MGSCGKNPKSLKGVCCTDAAGQTCFCGNGICRCLDTSSELLGDAAKCHDAHIAWCSAKDPSGKYSQFCKDYTQQLPEAPIVMGVKQGAGALGLTGDNLMLLAMGGLMLVALVMIVS